MEKITLDPWVLQVMQGYQIEFLKRPVQQVQARNLPLTPEMQAVLEQEVKDLLTKKAVHIVEPKAHS